MTPTSSWLSAPLSPSPQPWPPPRKRRHVLWIRPWFKVSPTHAVGFREGPPFAERWLLETCKRARLTAAGRAGEGGPALLAISEDRGS